MRGGGGVERNGKQQEVKKQPSRNLVLPVLGSYHFSHVSSEPPPPLSLSLSLLVDRAVAPIRRFCFSEKR